MIRELLNATDYANIYGLYDEGGAPIGEIEQILAGRYCGTYYYSLTSRYSRRDIKRLFSESIDRKTLRERGR